MSNMKQKPNQKLSKFEKEGWEQLRGRFVNTCDDTALNVFKELMRLDLIKETGAYMTWYLYDKDLDN